MTVKRETSLTVMNCQFEFTVTQCSVAYGEEEEKQNKTKQNQKKLTFCDAFPASLIIYWGSCSKIGL